MLKISIIGAEDTVNIIMDIAKEFSEFAEFIPFKYKDKKDTLPLTKKAEEESDVILYSGQAPYLMVTNAVGIHKPAIFIPRNGSSLYKIFWEIRNDNVKSDRISCEGLLENEIIETAEELGYENTKVFVNELDFSRELKYDYLINFHNNLWKNGQIDVAITGFTKVYIKLKQLGVPCYKLYPTRSLIRDYIHKAISLGEVEKARNTQTAVQVTKLRLVGDKKSDAYEFDLMKNKLESTLIKYARENFGSLFPHGLDEYLIFTNRGSIEHQFNYFDIKSDWLDEYENMVLSSGIGYGNNVKEAEYKARVALNYSVEKDYSCVYLVDENNNVTGPISTKGDSEITFDLSAGQDDKIRELSEKTSLSPVYVSKIQNLIKKLGDNILDVNTVKDYLGISERSARRVLNTLVESGVGEVKYTESKAKTGRPRKIYEIDFK